ncbi:MAG: hypothetical protein GTN76_15575, partial [Candidatus Aenigmarchaeota archaeon]|nr:hypothetical protein [Candidatus Aenigmarchaeota archaeon]
MRGEKFLYFYSRIKKIPVIPLLLIIVGLIAISALLLEQIDYIIQFILINFRLLAIIAVSIVILIQTILSSKNLIGQVTNYALLASSFLAMLLLLEVGCRVVAYYNDLNLLENIGQITRIPEKGEKVFFGQIIRLSKNPRIIYELVPNLSVIFQNQPVSTNSYGFRGKIVSLNKSKGSVRIVGIGDSVMFGWGVKDDETYLALLSGTLNRQYSEFIWEVVNTAVPGYNTVMEVETLKEKGIPFNPDIVIIGYVGNDLDLPNFIRKRENYLSLKKSFIKEFKGKLIHPPEIADGLMHAPFDRETGHFESNPRRVPEQYKAMVGLEAYFSAMKELQRLSKKYQFEVLVLSHRSLPKFVKDICSQLQFDTIEVLPAWKEYASKHRDENPVWQVSKADPHPSPVGHRVIGDTILKY